MLTTAICKTIDTSVRHSWLVIGVFVVLVAASVVYVARHFAINTDVGTLINPDAQWARRDAMISAAFPQRSDTTLVVVRAPAPEFASQAARELAQRLRAQHALFRSVGLGADSDFFARNGLLFLSVEQIAALHQQLTDARPLLNALAHDPSLRGLSNLLAVTLLTPLQTGQLKLADMAPLLDKTADVVDTALVGRPAALSWTALANAANPEGGGVHSLVEVVPVLRFDELQPGAASSDAIRAAANELRLGPRYGATVGLTGSVPLSDDEFSSVQEGSTISTAVTFAFVLLILWLALRSMKLVAAVFLTMLGGLALTAALGLLLVGSFNIISVAFAMLFVGIGVDFGIQFGMRFRARLLEIGDTHTALLAVSRTISLPLTLAAVATAIGFFAFLPTAYRGVAELGEIAGVGILFVAFPTCFTILPALIKVLNPPGASSMPGYRWLAPVDHTFQAHRKGLLYGTIAVVLAGVPLLWHLHFDFNPLHLKDPSSESMKTLRPLAGTGEIGIDNVQVLAPTLAAASALGERVARLSEVSRVMTLASFVPERQDEKLALIATLAAALDPALAQPPAPAAGDSERVSALRSAARALRNAALDYPGAGEAPARRLADNLTALAKAPPQARDRAEHALADPLRLSLASLRKALHPQRVTLDNVPPELRRDWVARDGRALLDIAPRKAPGVAPGDDTQLRNFADAVQRVAPGATGGPISVLNAAHVVVQAFIHAALLAVLAITVLLWITFRRVDDVLLTMVPLLVSGLFTLELCVLLNIKLNFANIIALPLLLGVGVAFKIYYVMAWRGGATELLQHGLTQAIILSAATTGTAFGSLWLSNHPGTASMGKLLVLALGCTLIGAVFFQPILMGKPRAKPRSK
ncbi:MMPL family transporter [Massilia solisilvae]|uniref:MMPL family transporter n=1 Tax=Massilia solisilvae TaxID=1811225 RepID=A0ABT2BJ48_9BURK|nr:MMPL family transporter [Massilia solisilvae]MCS0608529.1 MMPL family transporter [Massilia solisilvae]